MLTTDDLRDAMADAVDDPAAEAYTIGLSDRALADAGGQRAARRWMRPVPAIAVGTAFVVAGTFGVLALGGSGSGNGKRVTEMNAPGTVTDPKAQSALLDFEVECLDGRGPKMAMDWVWDPETQQYRAVDSSIYTSFTPSPDGKRALVIKGVDSEAWGVADWADAVAGRVALHPISDRIGVRWTTDGKELTSVTTWDAKSQDPDAATLVNKTADFYDPATASKRSVPIPQAVWDLIASRQWRPVQWQGGHDSIVFPMVSTAGDRVEWLNAQGHVIRTLTLKDGLPAGGGPGSPYLSIWFSPDGRYLAESNATLFATFDLNAGGRRIGQTRVDRDGIFIRVDSSPWSGDHDIVLTIDPATKDLGKPGAKESKTGHSPVYRVLSPELKVVEESKFVLPDDPLGYCASWPITWAPKTRFPGAFVP